MSNQPTFTIINRADGEYCLAIRGRKVVITLSNPSDPYQQWIRMDTGIKDTEGQPAYALVNKATNEAMMHNGTSDPDEDLLDESLLWTDSKNEEQGFMFIRRASFISYHITANAHQIDDGRIVDLSNGNHNSEWWKFIPYSKHQQETIQQIVTISCRRKEGFNLTIRDDTVMLAMANSRDTKQIWIKVNSYGKQAKDEDNRQSFALVNKATGKAIKHAVGPGYLVQLAPFNPDYSDASLLWTESDIKELGFREIRMATKNNSEVFHAFYVNEADSNKALLSVRPRNDSSDQRWKFQEISPSDASSTAPAKP